MKAYEVIWAGDPSTRQYIAARERRHATRRAWVQVVETFGKAATWRFRTRRAPQYDAQAQAQAEAWHGCSAVPIGWRDDSTREAWGCAEVTP